MFDKFGRKIKKIAKTLRWVGIILSISVGVGLLFDSYIWYVGLIIIVFGCSITYINSVFIYGLGEIIEKLTEISKNTKILKNTRFQIISTDDYNAIIKRYEAAIDNATADYILDCLIEEIKNIGLNIIDYYNLVDRCNKKRCFLKSNDN